MATDRRTSIRASQLKNFSVTGYDIKNASISGSQKLVDGSVTEPKLNIINNPVDGYYIKYTTASGMEWAEAGGASDHGGLAGLEDDDHAQYLLASGTRELTGDWDNANYSISAKGVRCGTTDSSLTRLLVSDNGVSGAEVGVFESDDANTYPLILRNTSATTTHGIQFYQVNSGNCYIYCRTGNSTYKNIYNQAKAHFFYSETTEKLSVDSSKVSVSADVIPSVSGTYDLGSSSLSWAEGHFDDLYVSGVPVPDYVFDAYYDETDEFEIKTLNESIKYMQEERHLPTMPSRAEIAEEQKSIGELITRLWETVEVQAIYISLAPLDEAPV